MFRHFKGLVQRRRGCVKRGIGEIEKPTDMVAMKMCNEQMSNVFRFNTLASELTCGALAGFKKNFCNLRINFIRKAFRRFKKAFGVAGIIQNVAANGVFNNSPKRMECNVFAPPTANGVIFFRKAMPRVIQMEFNFHEIGTK